METSLDDKYFYTFNFQCVSSYKSLVLHVAMTMSASVAS